MSAFVVDTGGDRNNENMASVRLNFPGEVIRTFREDQDLGNVVRRSRLKKKRPRRALASNYLAGPSHGGDAGRVLMFNLNKYS